MVTQPSTTSQTPTSAILAARSLPAVVALLLVFSAALLFTGTALASAPWNATSYYITSTDTTTAYDHGCDQANLDVQHASKSMVVLDFGGQTSDGSGTIDFNGSGNTYVTNGTVETVAESFAHGYNHCASNPTNVSAAQLLLSIGTNNSVAVSSSLGNTWAHVVAAVQSYDSSQGYTSHVDAIGGDDMEPGFGSASAARDWASGYSNESTSALYDDYGSADGCPTSGTATCNNGWTVADEYYLAWGARAAVATPEIYVYPMELQWANISLYGVNSGQGAITFEGSMATPHTGYYTPAQAFNAFQGALDNHTSTSKPLTYSLNITWNW